MLEEKMLSQKQMKKYKKILELSGEECKKLCSLIPLEETETIIFENSAKNASFW